MYRLKIISSLVFCLCFANVPAADAVKESVSEELVVNAIAYYVQNPLNEDARAAGSLVLRFAEQSQNIQIALSGKILPWITEKNKPPHADDLFIAYLVGNVQSQILRQKALDNPYAGMLMVLQVYELLKQKNADFSVQFIDKLRRIQLKGRLRQHMFSLLGTMQPEASGKDLKSRVNYPEKLGDYAYLGVQEYEKPEFGISVRYQKNKNDYFDVYVYPVSDQELEKPPKDAVLGEYSAARSGIYYGVERGVYQKLDPEKESLYKVVSNIYPVTRGVFKLMRDNKSLFTVLYVTISNEYFIKLRATYPNNQFKARSDHLEKIFYQALKSVHIQ